MTESHKLTTYQARSPGLAHKPPLGQLQAMAFEAAGVTWCLPLDEVDRVLLLPALDPFPGAPPWVAGLLVLPGEALPVVDLAWRSGHRPEEPYTLDTPLLVCRRATLAGALVVDRVLGVVPVDALEVADIRMPRNAYPLYRAAARSGDRSLLMIELAEALRIVPEETAHPVEAYWIPAAEDSPR